MKSKKKKTTRIKPTKQERDVRGAGGDPYLNVGVAHDLAKEFKHSQIHVLPLGHWPQIDDPKAVADLLVASNK